MDTVDKLFDEIDENERCDIIVSNLLYNDLFASNDEHTVTHVYTSRQIIGRKLHLWYILV